MKVKRRKRDGKPKGNQKKKKKERKKKRKEEEQTIFWFTNDNKDLALS